MPKSISVNPKKRGRPVTTGKGELIGVRLQPELLRRLDGWIVGLEEPLPTRPDAIRRLVEIGLAHAPRKRSHSPKQAARAAKLAAGVVDEHLAKEDARGHVKAQRRREILHGPRDR